MDPINTTAARAIHGAICEDGWRDDHEHGDAPCWKAAHATLDITSAEREATTILADCVLAIQAIHYPAHSGIERTPLCTGCNGAAGTHPCGCWRETQDEPICGTCCDNRGGPIPWPCDTYIAADPVIATGQEDPTCTCTFEKTVMGGGEIVRVDQYTPTPCPDHPTATVVPGYTPPAP